MISSTNIARVGSGNHATGTMSPACSDASMRKTTYAPGTISEKSAPP